MNGPSLRPVMATITAGLVLGVLAVFLLLAQTALAAGGVADESCLRCIYEADAARYSRLAEFYAAKLEAGRAADSARYRGLAAEYAAREETSLAANDVWYSAMAADFFARKEASLAADDGWYSGMARAYGSESENASFRASAERYNSLAILYSGKDAVEQCC